MLESAGFLGSSLIKYKHENFMRREGNGGQGAGEGTALGDLVPPAVPSAGSAWPLGAGSGQRRRRRRMAMGKTALLQAHAMPCNVGRVHPPRGRCFPGVGAYMGRNTAWGWFPNRSPFPSSLQAVVSAGLALAPLGTAKHPHHHPGMLCSVGEGQEQKTPVCGEGCSACSCCSLSMLARGATGPLPRCRQAARRGREQ